MCYLVGFACIILEGRASAQEINVWQGHGTIEISIKLRDDAAVDKMGALCGRREYPRHPYVVFVDLLHEVVRHFPLVATDPDRASMT